MKLKHEITYDPFFKTNDNSVSPNIRIHKVRRMKILNFGRTFLNGINEKIMKATKLKSQNRMINIIFRTKNSTEMNFDKLR